MSEEIKTLDDMINSEGYKIIESETVYSLQHRIINSSHYNDVENVTHQDIINSWYDYMDIIEIHDPYYVNIIKEMMEKEQWHEDNGSINHVIAELVSE